MKRFATFNDDRVRQRGVKRHFLLMAMLLLPVQLAYAVNYCGEGYVRAVKISSADSLENTQLDVYIKSAPGFKGEHNSDKIELDNPSASFKGFIHEAEFLMALNLFTVAQAAKLPLQVYPKNGISNCVEDYHNLVITLCSSVAADRCK